LNTVVVLKSVATQAALAGNGGYISGTRQRASGAGFRAAQTRSVAISHKRGLVWLALWKWLTLLVIHVKAWLASIAAQHLVIEIIIASFALSGTSRTNGACLIVVSVEP